MPTKWCSNCQKVITASYKLNWCVWCGKNLKEEKELHFKNWEDQCKQIEELKKNSNQQITKQLSLF